MDGANVINRGHGSKIARVKAGFQGSFMKLARTRAAEDEIFDQWGLGKFPQQSETENPPPGRFFCFDAFLYREALLAKERHFALAH